MAVQRYTWTRPIGYPELRYRLLRLAGRFTRCVGARVFAQEDAAARAEGWVVIECRGGLGRSYRDPRWDRR